MLNELVELFIEKESEVFEWLEAKRAEHRVPVYASCDIRNSGVKLATVDTNLFPAGWNNLCPSYQKIASKEFREFFDERFGAKKCILLLTEEHTRNPYYFSNVKALVNILEGADFRVYVGNPNVELTETTVFETSDNEELKVHPIRRDGDYIYAGDQKVCIVMLNNDFSGGGLEILDGIKQPVVPNPDLGWHKRLKSDHFKIYNDLIDEFAELIGFDSWHLKAQFNYVDGIDINDENGRERIAVAVDEMIRVITDEYRERGLLASPVIFVKNNSGTYGMGVISVKSGDEVRSLNRKARNKLSIGKSGKDINNFLLQEGIPTTDKIKGMTAEPVIYIAGGKVCGGFFRVHESKGDNENLNSPGMKFVKFCFEKVLGYENEHAGDCDLDCLDKLYRIVGEIAAIAAGMEENKD